MLELIFSKSDIIKTEYIRKLVVGDVSQRVFLLVPDQFSFQTEKAILDMAGAKRAANIKVFTFSRLASEVFSLYGGIYETKLSDMGKMILMSNAVSACADNLELLGSAAKADRLTSLMLNFVEEMKTSFVSAEDIIASSKTLDTTLGQKTYEAGLIYSTYEQLLKGVYVDADDMISIMAKLVLEHKYFKDASVYIDGFEYFNKQKRKVLASIIKDSEKTVCALPIDDMENSDEDSAFSQARNTARNLIKIAREENIRVKAPVKLTHSPENKAESLVHLEKNIYADFESQIYENCGDIQIFEAEDIYEEAQYVSATIRKLIIEGKYRYSDIAVLCRNSEAFTGVIDFAFKQWDIPIYLAKAKNFSNMPLACLVILALDVLETSYNSGAVLSMLKTGLCPLDLEEISELENYVFLWNIRGSQWKNEFTKSPFGFDSADEELENTTLQRLEETRKKIINPLVKLEKSLKKEKCTEKCTAIFKFLTDLDVENAVLKKRQEFLLSGMEEQAEESVRAWNMLMQVLDCFVTTMGEENVKFLKFSSMIKEVMKAQELSDIPLKLDTVNFANAQQVKIQDAKVVFVIGAVQGEFPLDEKESGLFSDSERRSLVEAKIELENDLQSRISAEKFVAYTALNCASERLYLSFHKSRGQDSFVQSSMVTHVLEIFSDLEIKSGFDEEYYVNSKDALLSFGAKNYLSDSESSKTYVKLIEEIEEFAPRLLAIRRAVSKIPFKLQDKALSKKMFFENQFSASQVEGYHECKFRYFCRYGLGAKERKTAKLSALEYGNIMHYLFEKMLVGDYTGEEDLMGKIDELLHDYIVENMGGIENLSAVDRYRVRRISVTAYMLIARVLEELSQSKFKPKFNELRLKNSTEFPPLKVKTKDGNMAYVSGVIDRVDTYEADGKTYVRVIDYKTGSKEFKLSDILLGLNLQMLLYLAAICQSGVLHPAGMLYLPAISPNISAKKGDDEKKLMSEFDKQLCMKGLVLSKEEIIKAMEEQANGRFIPVSIKGEKLKGEESTFSDNSIELIFSHVKRLVSSMADSLLEGEIEAQPLTINANACAYCPYESVCGAKNYGKDIEKMSMKNAEIIQKLREEENENGKESVD